MVFCTTREVRYWGKKCNIGVRLERLLSARGKVSCGKVLCNLLEV